MSDEINNGQQMAPAIQDLTCSKIKNLNAVISTGESGETMAQSWPAAEVRDQDQAGAESESAPLLMKPCWQLRTLGFPAGAWRFWQPHKGPGARLSCGPAAAFCSCKPLHRTRTDSLVSCAQHTGDCKVCNQCQTPAK